MFHPIDTQVQEGRKCGQKIRMDWPASSPRTRAEFPATKLAAHSDQNPNRAQRTTPRARTQDKIQAICQAAHSGRQRVRQAGKSGRVRKTKEKGIPFLGGTGKREGKRKVKRDQWPRPDTLFSSSTDIVN